MGEGIRRTGMGMICGWKTSRKPGGGFFGHKPILQRKCPPIAR